jgi:hypothetical protein
MVSFQRDYIEIRSLKLLLNMFRTHEVNIAINQVEGYTQTLSNDYPQIVRFKSVCKQ